MCVVFRLLSQAVSDDVCKAIKNLIDTHAKSRKLVCAYFRNNVLVTLGECNGVM